jgi:hypothetical protein
MAINTGHFSEALDPGIRKWYGDEYKEFPEQYTKMMDVVKSTKAIEYTMSQMGLGSVPEMSQGSGVTYDEAQELYKNTTAHTAFGLGFKVTKIMFEDDLYRRMESLSKALARSVRHSTEILGTNVYNNGFDATAAIGADGKELFASNHPLGGGGTYRNELETPADLSNTSLEQALIDIGDLVDDRGFKVNAMAKMLMVSSTNQWNAKVILGSDQLPGGANNDLNAAKGAMPFMVNNFFTDPDAWFIKTDVPNGPVFYWRRKPEFTKDNDFDSENGKWKVTFRCSQTWDDPRAVFGSAGA